MFKQGLLRLLCFDSYIIRSKLSKKEILRLARNIESFDHTIHAKKLTENTFLVEHRPTTAIQIGAIRGNFFVSAKGSIVEHDDETLIHLVIHPPLAILCLFAIATIAVVLFPIIAFAIRLASGLADFHSIGNIVFSLLLFGIACVFLHFTYQSPIIRIKSALETAFTESEEMGQ